MVNTSLSYINFNTNMNRKLILNIVLSCFALYLVYVLIYDFAFDAVRSSHRTYIPEGMLLDYFDFSTSHALSGKVLQKLSPFAYLIAYMVFEYAYFKRKKLLFLSIILAIISIIYIASLNIIWCSFSPC